MTVNKSQHSSAQHNTAEHGMAQHSVLAMRFTILSFSCGRPSHASPVTCSSHKWDAPQVDLHTLSACRTAQQQITMQLSASERTVHGKFRRMLGSPGAA